MFINVILKKKTFICQLNHLDGQTVNSCVCVWGGGGV